MRDGQPQRYEGSVVTNHCYSTTEKTLKSVKAGILVTLG